MVPMSLVLEKLKQEDQDRARAGLGGTVSSEASLGHVRACFKKQLPFIRGPSIPICGHINTEVWKPETAPV